MGNFLFVMYLAVGTIILTVLLTHVFVKKIHFMSLVGDYLVFRKFFLNKKQELQPQVGSKVVISFNAIISFLFSLSSMMYVSALAVMDELGNESVNEVFLRLLKVMFVMLLIMVAVRLVYEFVVIPIFCTSGQPQYYMHNNQPMNTNMGLPQNNGEFKFCTQCGTRYHVTESICPKCGKR